MASSTLVLHRFLRQYVDELKALDVLQSIAIEIEQAFEAVHRHEFVEEFEVGDGKTYKVAGPQTAHNVLDLIYSNTPLLTDRDLDGKPASSSSEPSLIATMLQSLDVEPSMKVLEIGTGTGYNAALIAELTKDQSSVTTIDVNKRVISRAKRLMANAGYSGIFVASGDGVEGYSKRSPYDRIVATAAFPDFPWELPRQLSEGGLVLIPLQHGGGAAAPLVKAWNSSENCMVGRIIDWAGFMPIRTDLLDDTPWPSSFPEVDSRHVDAEYDHFDALLNSRMTLSDYRKGQRTWWDFHFYLGIADPRACHAPSRIGLVDKDRKSAIVVDKKSIKQWGDDSLFEDLEKYYREWDEMGRPKTSDWNVTLSKLATNETLQPRKDGAFVLRRPRTIETLALSESSQR